MCPESLTIVGCYSQQILQLERTNDNCARHALRSCPLRSSVVQRAPFAQDFDLIVHSKLVLVGMTLHKTLFVLRPSIVCCIVYFHPNLICTTPIGVRTRTSIDCFVLNIACDEGLRYWTVNLCENAFLNTSCARSLGNTRRSSMHTEVKG